MKKTLLLICLLLLAASSFLAQTSPEFDIQGHRGARGLIPENTIPSFLKALEYGVNTLELDLAVSRDNKLVVSHEPWFASVISLDPQGRPIPADRQKQHNIYKMNYSQIKRYDVGSLGHKDFPEQRKMKARKPLLSEVFRAVGAYLRKNNLPPVRYNIEIKSTTEGDGTFHPAPDVFAKLVYDEIRAHKLENFATVQSFDPRPLQALRKLPVKLTLALLVMNKDGAEKNIERLGFTPEIYSPHFSLVDEALVRYCREKGMKIIPWTINETSDMEKMKKFNLDGIITDYPDRAVKIFRN